jgi:hypothetical protein
MSRSRPRISAAIFRAGTAGLRVEIDSDRIARRGVFRPPYGWISTSRDHKIGTVKASRSQPPRRRKRLRKRPARTDLPPRRRHRSKHFGSTGAGRPRRRIHVGGVGSNQLRCCDEWLFGMSEYIQKDELAGPFGTLEEAVRTGCGWYRSRLPERPG